ncbi:MAG: nuclear transport factor 2 family protein [Bacteroidia bacterium]|nr:nuclear transport factor 2 family protein [Bacteroidia bacterium]
MNSNELMVNKFYTCFQKKDWKGMQGCYADDVTFSDPVFQNLKGKNALAMWHMLVSAGKDLTVSSNNIKANDLSGSCDWEAHYSFSRTGRKVHNIIHAEFKFEHGKIVEHCDSFDLWRWSRMALGTSGVLLGWSSIVRNKIRGTANSSLHKFINEHHEYRSE